MAETRLSSERPFEGHLVNVRVDQVKLPSGRESVREVVEHPGAIGILPVTEQDTILLVRQYRYAVDRTLLEIPAGTREEGERAEETAIRELREEIGMNADQIELLTRFFVSPGWCTEELTIYRATGLNSAELDPEDDEDIETVEIGPDEIPGRMRDGQIADAKTITALLAHLSQTNLT